MGSLSKKLLLSRIKPCVYRKIDVNKLRANPVKSKDDWLETHFTSLKRYLRYELYETQKRRCAYCRRILNPLGINEHIDHIIARKLYINWMFKPRNLVLTCYQCNTQKSVAPTLKKDHRRLPRRARHYKLFNPFVHSWTHHFELLDDLFLSGKSKIGENTIKALKLFDYKYSLRYAEESNTFGKSAIVRAAQRMAVYDKKSIEFKSAKKLIKEIERHI
ncbi:MAG: hypothetical protein C0433_10265 [Cyclobacterium sp.]|nr:hypothetical protein [Cyclobacterium sp.]